MNYSIKDKLQQSYLSAGNFALALRLVVGWTYFSAFWRRLVLENKLDPDVSGYIGEKFNHFLPNALGIKPVIEYLVSNPDLLWWAMVIFTLVEACVGLMLMLGFLTRLMSLGVLALATGILLGSGWLGTTCLDEWQIGILGMAAGFVLFLTGGGQYSLDHRWLSKTSIGRWKVYPWIASGLLPLKEGIMHRLVIGGSLFIFFMALFTNQVFHGGIWGQLHNKSVKPIVEISNTSLNQNEMRFTLFRVEGVDVYGSFLIGITLKDPAGNVILNYDGETLSHFSPTNIHNHYVAKVKPGKHSLVIPLGAKADIIIPIADLPKLQKGKYQLILTDISGIQWKKEVTLL